MTTDIQKKKDRQRMADRRERTNHAYDRARNRAIARLLKKHRQEFQRLLAEELGQV